MKKMITAFAAAVITVSCGTTAGIPKKIVNQPELNGTQWSLAENVKGQIPTLNFENEKINGNAGCNSFFGTATVNPANGAFTTSNIGSTRKACQYMETENNFLNMLPQVNRYRVNGNVLELFKDNLVLLKFNRR